jgi:AraC-like DNA-binding protein
VSNLIRATAMFGYQDLVRELGADPALFLARFHIRDGIENEEDAFLSFDPFLRMVQATAEELECPDFGLRLAGWQGLDILGPIAVIARNSHSVQDGFDAIARFLFVHSPALTLSKAVPTAEADRRFRYEIDAPLDLDVRQGYELSMANGVRILRLLGGPDARPTAMSFMHDQMGTDEAYRRTLDCPVRFGQTWCGFELVASLADQPIDSADPATRRIAAKYLEAQFVPRAAGLSDHVTELARRLLPTGHCTVDAIADHLALHPRALQRRLADEGVRCQELIEQERRNLAAKYLADPRLHLGQVSRLLGYTEQSTLNRSCRRWFGQTPNQYRTALSAARTPLHSRQA